MAYRALAQNCEVQRDIVAARRYLDKARGLSGHLSENERLLMEGRGLLLERRLSESHRGLQ